MYTLQALQRGKSTNCAQQLRPRAEEPFLLGLSLQLQMSHQERWALRQRCFVPSSPSEDHAPRGLIEVLQLCLKLRTSQWPEVLRASILLSVLSWAVSQCWEQARLLRFRGLGHSFIYSAHQTRACVDDHPCKSFLYAYKIDWLPTPCVALNISWSIFTFLWPGEEKAQCRKVLIYTPQNMHLWEKEH